MIIWLLYSFITVLWSKDIAEYIKFEFFILFGVLEIILFNNCFRTVEDILSAFRAFIIGVVIQSAVGWYEVFTGNYLFVAQNRVINIINHETVNIPVAMLYNPNDFGTLMFFGCFIAYLLLRNEKKKGFKVIYGLIMCSCIILLISSKSTTCILGLLVGFATILVLSSKLKSAVLVLASSALLFVPSINSFLIARVSFTGNSRSNAVRLLLIESGIKFLGNTFGFGIGTGQQAYWLKNYSSYDYLGSIEQFHNWWFEILFVYGVIIFVLYIVYYINLVKCFYAEYKTKKNMICFCLVAILIGYIIASISSSSNFRTESIWIFWAICISYQGLYTKTQVFDELTHYKTSNNL